MAAAAAAAAGSMKRAPRAKTIDIRRPSSKVDKKNSDEGRGAAAGYGSHKSNLHELLESEQAEQQAATSQHWLLDSMVFHATITSLIVANTIVMGLEADYPEWTELWTITENVFTAAFSLELIVKLWILGRQYFRDFANFLDFALVVCGIIDTWILQLLDGGLDLQSLTIFRCIRIFRLGRILRLLRHFEHLLIIMMGVFDAIRSTCWVTLILLAVIYACAIFCTDFIGHGEPTLYPGYSTEDSAFDSSTIMQDFNPYVSFGSMARSMFTLFNMVILSEWAEVTRPLMAKQPYFVFFFVVFVIFTTFGLMNVVVGMIVDNVMTHVSEVMAEKQEGEVKRKLGTVSELERFMTTIDEDGDGKLTLPELEKALKRPDMQSLIKDVKLPRDIGPHELLAMLDDDGDSMLVGDEFVRGFYRLIEADQFQHACINQIAINSVKSMVRHEIEVAMQTRDLVNRLNANLEELRAEVRASLGSQRGMVSEEEGFINAGKPMSLHSKMEPQKSNAEVASQPASVLRQAAPQLHPCAYSAEGIFLERGSASVPILESTADLGLHCRVELQDETPKDPSLAPALARPWASACMQEQQTWSPEAEDPQSLTTLYGQQFVIKPRDSSGGLEQPEAEGSAEVGKAVGEVSLQPDHGARSGDSEQV